MEDGSKKRQLANVLVLVVLSAAAAFAWSRRLDRGHALHASVNAPGEKIDVARLLVPGKLSVVYFYADW
jgi:hypothetical protein